MDEDDIFADSAENPTPGSVDWATNLGGYDHDPNHISFDFEQHPDGGDDSLESEEGISVDDADALLQQLTQASGDGAPAETSVYSDTAPVAVYDTDITALEDGFSQDLLDQLAEQEGRIDGTDAEALGPSPQQTLQVAIPEMPEELRDSYEATASDIVEIITTSVEVDGDILFNVEFSDCRQELISRDTLLDLYNGRLALHYFQMGEDPPYTEMSVTGRKRKHVPDDDWGSDSESPESDRMAVDDDDDIAINPAPTRNRGISGREMRALRSRGSTSNTHGIGIVDSDDSDELTTAPKTRSRRLRPRSSIPTSTAISPDRHGNGDVGRDELLDDPSRSSNEADDDDFPIVFSDVVQRKGRPSRKRLAQQRHRRTLQASRASTTSRQISDDSGIEFEAPRRSARATRNLTSMRDDVMMDDDSYYAADDKPTDGPKAISVRENFQPIPAESNFRSAHMNSCHVCGGSKNRGQLVYCQGCSLTYHRACLGTRSAREHLVTKVGEDNFVLQCRFCIGAFGKKDKNAPKPHMCQTCKEPGLSCAPFSVKKTTRQEEKLREENGGVDPVVPVDTTLINNDQNVLFRCVNCHRGWHLKHLPSAGSDSVATDIRSERLKDYAVDWHCNDCSSAKHKIHRIVAWRPVGDSTTLTGESPSYENVDEDHKEYLVKWANVSYGHCSWVSGAWLYGVAAAATRASFGRRAVEQDILKSTVAAAVPDEFLMPDVVLNVKMVSGTPRAKTKEEALSNISLVSKIFVKYQGLGYDDVVWDSPPRQDADKLYPAFLDAYWEYVEGKFFQHEPLQKIRDRIKEFKAADFEQVNQQPDGLKRGKLMAYQLEGLNWLLQNYHGGKSVVLADEMGLGKTVQVISLVTSLVHDSPKCWPFLIVVPNSTCPNWRREFKQWAPDLRVVTYHGGKESQDLAYKYELFPEGSKDMKAHVVIMSYDSAQDPRTKDLFKHAHWAGLVVDEGQRLKNDQNLLYVALQSMKIPFRLLLTGTPLQNNKRELFNLLQFIDESQSAAKLDEEFEVLDKENLPKLHEKIRPYFLRRTKAGVLKFLPPMAQIILPVTMTGLQEKLAKSIMAKNPQLIKAMFANSKMKKTERGSLNNILMQLRKCLCHPFMYSEAIEEKYTDHAIMQRNLIEASSKLMLLETMLPKLKERGHRVLIFSQFLQQLDIIEDFLAGLGFEYRRLDGQISSLEKQRRIDAYNEPDSSVFAFLLSTRAGGVGINLATADTVIIMDPDFNPHQDIQAISRAHRIGQKQKVLCFQLMTKDSIEERIMQVGRKKMALDHALIESMDDDELAGDDLESILKHGAQALFDDDYEKKAIHYDAAAIDKLLDRTQMEQTKTNDEGSAEAQFSYARVWANEKSGFDVTLAVEEEQAPEPLNSSVWDRIIAQREEEAKKEAEANKEVLGRGGRRRIAINYKTNAVDNALLLEGMAGESDDSSDEFAAGAESADGESDEDEKAMAKGKADAANEGEPSVQLTNATKNKVTGIVKEQQEAAQVKAGRKSKWSIGRPGKQGDAAGTPTAPDTYQNAKPGKGTNGSGTQQGRRPGQIAPPATAGRRGPGSNVNGARGTMPPPSQYATQPNQYPYYMSQQAQSGMLVTRYVASNGSGAVPPGAMPPPLPPGYPDTPETQKMMQRFYKSEALLRLRIDEIQRSLMHKDMKQNEKNILLGLIRELKRQSAK